MRIFLLVDIWCPSISNLQFSSVHLHVKPDFIGNQDSGNSSKLHIYIPKNKTQPDLQVVYISMSNLTLQGRYSVFHNFISPNKELCSKIALGKVGVSLP